MSTYTVDKIEYSGNTYNIQDNVSKVELTQAQYDLLTPAEKSNGNVYFVYDGTPTPGPTPVSSLQNLVDGSATASVRGVGTTAESSSYTMGQYAFAEGYGTKASGNFSHTEGSSTIASGGSSHAEGDSTTVSGDYSHVEGFSSTVSGSYSHAEGILTIASGDSSHAEGAATTASGEASHAEGDGAIASGNGSHAQNTMTIAQRKSQTALGEYNIADTSGTITTRGEYAVIVGNGTADNARSNALTVDWSGDVDIASGAHYKINGSNLSASDVGAQATLISGTNIKTINNQSLLGSGNIPISVSGTSIPTADTVAEFDSTAHMNSTDMTTAEVTSFVNSLDLTGSKAADYIVEQGTSGIWVYRKWASGIAECWGTYSWAISTWTQWGSSIYYSTYSETINYPTGLFTSEPILTTSQNGTSNDNWLGMRSGPNYGNTKDHTNSFFLLRPNAGSTDMTAYVYAHAIGRWK